MKKKILTKHSKPKKKKVIFLDRDGVINRYPGRRKYVTSLRSFKLIPGSLRAIKKLTEAGFIIFIISNQAGVAKKIYTKAALKAITHKMLLNIKRAGGSIRKVLYCTHLPETNCACRKPKTASVKKAMQSLDSRIDRTSSYLIGDDIAKDIVMGKRSHLKTILVLSGRDRRRVMAKRSGRPDYVFKNLLEATKFILKTNA
ncbi:MAG: HAD-IIIA family hydrolase [Candidatus Omnitrophica bacterium]|nr:HAD-IIIA family hydrolase [Candidatus Omnitrophota bacterium]